MIHEAVYFMTPKIAVCYKTYNQQMLILILSYTTFFIEEKPITSLGYRLCIVGCMACTSI